MPAPIKLEDYFDRIDQVVRGFRRVYSCDPEDLRSCAALALVQAQNDYDSNKCDDFGAFAYKRMYWAVRGAVEKHLKELRRFDVMPSYEDKRLSCKPTQLTELLLKERGLTCQ